MRKYIFIVGLALALGVFASSKIVRATTEPAWGTCESTGAQCGTDNGTQSRDVDHFTNPICPRDYHLQNSGNWDQRCHRDYNWMHPEHKAPIGCPEGNVRDGVFCKRVVVEHQSCQTGVIQYDSCTPEVDCPTYCGYEGGEVADGKGGQKSCEATTACEVDQCVNIDGMQTEVPEGYYQDERDCFPKEKETEDVCSNLEGVQESVPEGYTMIDNICVLTEQEDKPESKTFHKDRRCLDTTPEAPQWATRTAGEGGVNATWSAMGGDKVQIQINNAAGEWEYEFGETVNDGHEFLPNMAMSQLYRIRVINGCKEGEWLIDP